MKSKYYIYKLLDSENEILYIGKTTNLDNRIKSHINDNRWKKELKEVQYIEFDNGYDMSIYEIYFINKYNPKYNKDCNYDKGSNVELDNLKFKVYKKLDELLKKRKPKKKKKIIYNKYEEDKEYQLKMLNGIDKMYESDKEYLCPSNEELKSQFSIICEEILKKGIMSTLFLKQINNINIPNLSNILIEDEFSIFTIREIIPSSCNRYLEVTISPFSQVGSWGFNHKSGFNFYYKLSHRQKIKLMKQAIGYFGYLIPVCKRPDISHFANYYFDLDNKFNLIKLHNK